MTASFDVPADRHYDGEHHLWALREEDTGPVRVGIDALGLAELGHLAFVALDALGTTVRRGEPIGTLEAEKMTARLVAPVSGTLVERNEEVLRDPQLVNRDPHGDGWLIAIDPTSWETEVEELISGDAIGPWVEAETARFRSEGWLE